MIRTDVWLNEGMLLFIFYDFSFFLNIVMETYNLEIYSGYQIDLINLSFSYSCFLYGLESKEIIFQIHFNHKLTAYNKNHLSNKFYAAETFMVKKQTWI